MSDYSSTFPTQRPKLDLQFDKGSDQLDSRISFSRADTPPSFAAPSAVHYWSNEKSLNSENLLKYSTAFDNAAWTTNNMPAPTTGQTDPSGGTGGCILIADTTNGSHNKFQSQAVSGDLCFTVYAKPAAGTMRMMLNLYNATNNWEIFLFDLVGGTPVAASGTSSTFSNVSATQTASGNGYYKCTIKATGSITSALLALNPNATTSGLNAYGGISFAGDDTAGITVAFASLSTVGSSDYNATTSQIHRQYISTLKSVANSGDPRFEYDPITGNSEGLLIESQSSNLATYGSDLTNAVWNPISATAATAAIGPDGTLSAAKLTSGTGSGIFPRFRRLAFLSTSKTQTFSVYVKPLEYSYLNISQDGHSTQMVHYNLTGSGSISSAAGCSGTVEQCGNGWYRVSFTHTNATSSANLAIVMQSTATYSSETGNSYDGMLFASAQLEDAATASSFIGTTSSTVTRAVDSCSVATADFGYSGGPVTVVGEIAGTGSGYSALFELRDTVSKAAGINDYMMVWKTNATDTNASNFSLYIYDNSTLQAGPTISGSGGATTIAARLDTNNVGACADGGTVATDTSAIIVDSLDTLYIGRGFGGYELGSTIKRLALYNVALSDTELQSMTS